MEVRIGGYDATCEGVPGGMSLCESVQGNELV